MLWIILGIIVSYLIGSIPTAYLFGRVFKGIDIRKFGSGNVGATNALRVLGKPAGISVLIIDTLKGFIPAAAVSDLIASNSHAFSLEALCIIMGLASILGHTLSIFLNFKGGKGVATTFGVLIALALIMPGLRIVLLFAVLTWLASFFIFRIISLASVITAASLPVYMVLLRHANNAVAVAMLLAAFIIFKHRSNLKRLFEGKEPRLNLRNKP